MIKSTRLVHIALVLLFTVSGFTTYAQVAKENDARIAAVYGTYVKDLNKEQVAWLHNQLERSSIAEIPYKTDENLPLLSGLPLVTKYIADIKRDDLAQPLKINPLKYRINFRNPADQLFRIDGTDYVLLVKGRK